VGVNRTEKEKVVKEVSQVLSGAQAAVVAEYSGLTVAQMTELRTKAREAGVYLRVVKNTLVRRAVQATPFQSLDGQLTGPLAFAASADPVAVAKVLSEFAKTQEKLVVKAGAMSGQLMSKADIAALAKLPGRQELLATLAGTLQAPIVKFVRTLNEVPARFVRTLAAVRDARAA
jgi:large subunit ribosomal protein L10